MMLMYVRGSLCETFMVNIVVTYRRFTSWKMQPSKNRTIGFNGRQLPPISQSMRWLSVMLVR